MGKQCIACGKKAGIKEKDNFCPACGAKLPECVKPSAYVSERVVNISVLEKHIENAYLSINSMIKGIESGELFDVYDIAKHLKSVEKGLEKAYEFDFCVERRTTLCR